MSFAQTTNNPSFSQNVKDSGSSSCVSSDQILVLIGNSSDCIVPGSSNCKTSTLLGKLESLSGLLGNPSDCYPSSIEKNCQSTVFGILNNFLYDKFGSETNMPGQNTLFQLVNLINQSVSSTTNSFGEKTIFGIVENLENSINNIVDHSNLNIGCLVSGFARGYGIIAANIDIETGQSVSSANAYDYIKKIDWTDFCENL